MVLTQEELLAALENEVRILLHLAGKVEPRMLDYRPTRTQRSTLELLQYLAVMGPTQLAVIEGGVFDRPALAAAWRPAEAAAARMTVEEAVAAIRALTKRYGDTVGQWGEAEFRAPVDVFGRKRSRGAMVVELVLGGHAAYRTQLFCYLKACGRDELSTMNLWAGIDAPG